MNSEQGTRPLVLHNSPTGANGYPEGVVGAFHGFGEIAANYYRSNMVK